MKHKPKTPEQHRIYVVGDIHGRIDLLDRLLAMIESDALINKKKKKKIVFLGDYIDRGLDSRGVIERLTKTFAENIEPIFIRGNHDEYFLEFLDGRFEMSIGWLNLGGGAALASYGINSLGKTAGQASLLKLVKEVKEKVPADHIEFLENTVYSVTLGDYYFVHAGVRPGVPLDKQVPQDQTSIRGDFLFSNASFEKMIIHGHTIRPEPEIKPNRIGIDTGAFATGRLTCLILDGAEQKFLST